MVFTNRRAFFYGIAGTFLFAAVLGFILPGQQIFAEQYGWGAYYPLAMTCMGGSAAICSLLASRAIGIVGVRRTSHWGAVILPLLAFGGAIVSATVGLNGFVYLGLVMAFAIPLGIATYGVLSYSSDNIAFAGQERLGAAWIAPLNDLLRSQLQNQSTGPAIEELRSLDRAQAKALDVSLAFDQAREASGADAAAATVLLYSAVSDSSISWWRAP